MIVLRSARGIEAGVLAYGATLASLRVPDARGRLAEILLGFETAEGYRGVHPHFGGIVGRYANRIACGRFTLEGREYRLATNDGRHHLHGGGVGFDRVEWETRTRPGSVELRHRSPGGEEGYPGTLDARVTYTLDGDALRIDLEASTDGPTIVNLTNHAYFNLRGAGEGDVLDHELEVAADAYTPTDAEGIPTGELRPVDGTPLDFREPVAVGARIHRLDDGRGGYDHNLVLRAGASGPHLTARLRDPHSGRTLEVRTTQPGLQLYSGNFLDGSVAGFERHAGLCLEPQHFPDSPNQPHFPSSRLDPGERYRHVIVLRFPEA